MAIGSNFRVNERIANGIAIVITLVWAISFLADIFIEEYDPSPYIHFLMLAMAGAIFGHSFFKEGEKDVSGG